MKCEEFRQNLEQDVAMDSAADHAKTCADCDALQADFDAIHAMALELATEEIAPPERVWVSLRAQLESEGLIYSAVSKPQRQTRGWWTAFQKPAFAGGFLAVILLAGVFSVFQGGDLVSVQNTRSSAEALTVPAPGTALTVKDELLTAVNETVSGFAQEDPALTNSLRKNLDIVDNLIDVCEKSVREEPENEAARDYLNGAYQQKAELLATAMNHGAMGGLR